MGAVADRVVGIAAPALDAAFLGQAVQRVVLVVQGAPEAVAVLLDIAIGIVLIVALPGADLLPQQLVVLVILAAEGDAVAPGQAQQRAEGQVGDLPDQGARRLVAHCQGHAGDLAAGVARVADGEAGG